MEFWIVLLVYIMVAMVCFEIRSVAGKLNHIKSGEVVGNSMTITQSVATIDTVYVSSSRNVCWASSIS
jgi:hypothetical protein